MNAEVVTIAEPAILVRINRSYRQNMSDVALYEATRGVWRLGPRRDRAQIALAIYEGIVREVYEIREWLPAGSTRYETRTFDAAGRHGRWEFTGSVATPALRKKYRGKSVAEYFMRGSQAPVLYVNID